MCEFTRSLGIPQDPRSKMSKAEITAIAVISARLFGSNLDKTRLFLMTYHYISHMLSKSRLIRLIHRIPPIFWEYILGFLQEISPAKNNEFIIDSFPVPLCARVRKYRCRLKQSRDCNGYHAAKDEFFFGLKVHVITTVDGQPVELKILPGSIHDMKALKQLKMRALKRGSNLYGDKAYTNYSYEDFLWDEQGIALLVPKKILNQKPYTEHVKRYINRRRKRIETAFSDIKSWLGQKIHAVTLKGFELKITLAVVALAFKIALRD